MHRVTGIALRTEGGTNMTFSGLMLFDASVDAGFGEHGRVDLDL